MYCVRGWETAWCSWVSTSHCIRLNAVILSWRALQGCNHLMLLPPVFDKPYLNPTVTSVPPLMHVVSELCFSSVTSSVPLGFVRPMDGGGGQTKLLLGLLLYFHSAPCNYVICFKGLVTSEGNHMIITTNVIYEYGICGWLEVNIEKCAG
jgi:hypothetical protein